MWAHATTPSFRAWSAGCCPLEVPKTGVAESHRKLVTVITESTLERDLDLAAMSVENGWGSQDIAVDLGLDTKAVKARWDALTGLSRDDKTDKWVRRYAGRAVLDRLKTLSGAV